ncbi:MAG: hypothetical protein MUQ99_11170, partial [Pseudomonadales bacterium]|nr:hypothetical protein [Pseudomonadales bacterium]
DMHIHAFSPLEVWQGAKTLGQTLPEYLTALKEAGLGTLPVRPQRFWMMRFGRRYARIKSTPRNG